MAHQVFISFWLLILIIHWYYNSWLCFLCFQSEDPAEPFGYFLSVYFWLLVRTSGLASPTGLSSSFPNGHFLPDASEHQIFPSLWLDTHSSCACFFTRSNHHSLFNLFCCWTVLIDLFQLHLICPFLHRLCFVSQVHTACFFSRRLTIFKIIHFQLQVFCSWHTAAFVQWQESIPHVGDPLSFWGGQFRSNM